MLCRTVYPTSLSFLPSPLLAPLARGISIESFSLYWHGNSTCKERFLQRRLPRLSLQLAQYPSPVPPVTQHQAPNTLISLQMEGGSRASAPKYLNLEFRRIKLTFMFWANDPGLCVCVCVCVCVCLFLTPRTLFQGRGSIRKSAHHIGE